MQTPVLTSSSKGTFDCFYFSAVKNQLALDLLTCIFWCTDHTWLLAHTEGWNRWALFLCPVFIDAAGSSLPCWCPFVPWRLWVSLLSAPRLPSTGDCLPFSFSDCGWWAAVPPWFWFVSFYCTMTLSVLLPTLLIFSFIRLFSHLVLNM